MCVCVYAQAFPIGVGGCSIDKREVESFSTKFSSLRIIRFQREISPRSNEIFADVRLNLELNQLRRTRAIICVIVAYFLGDKDRNFSHYIQNSATKEQAPKFNGKYTLCQAIPRDDGIPLCNVTSQSVM